MRDLRLAFRTLWRQPGYSALAVVILGLGLGAAIATFALVEALVLRVAPYPEADRLVQLLRTAGQERSRPHSPAALRDYRAQGTVFEDVAGFARRDPVLEEPGRPAELVWGLNVTASFFRILRVPPRLGRVFTADEEQRGNDRVAILSARLWQGRFGSDPDIVGRRLLVDGQTVTVVGVMPPEFNETPRYWGRTDLWRPMTFAPAQLGDRNFNVLDVFARLKPGVTLAGANAELGALADRLNAAHGTRSGLRAISLRDRQGQNETGHVAWLTLALAVLLLAIACINLAGVQVARMAARGHEQAVRLALGASRGQLVRQALAESLLLGLAGGVLGLLVAHLCTELLGPRILIDGARQVLGVRLANALDGRTLLFTLALVLATTLIVGTVPAWASTRTGLAASLRKGDRATVGRSRPRLRQGLVVAEMSLALIVLAAGALFLRGLARFEDRDPGWKVDGLLTARVTLPAARYPSREASAAFLQRLSERVAALPGVERSALAWIIPVGGFAGGMRFQVEGTLIAAERAPETAINGVTPGYFDTLGLRLREGRLFTDADSGEPVVIVNETMARQVWPGQSAVGKRIADLAAAGNWRRVVGVVADVAYPAQLKTPESRYQSYFPMRPGNGVAIALRARAPLAPQALAGDLRRVVAELDPALPLVDPISARAHVTRYLGNFALMGWILFGLAGLGLALSALGVYGLFSGFVAERTREIGVRMALGAQAVQVLRLVLGKGLRLAVLGAAIGVGGAMMVAKVLTSAVSELPASDPAAVVVLALVLVGVALLACWLPARRAARLDPMAALRQE